MAQTLLLTKSGGQTLNLKKEAPFSNNITIRLRWAENKHVDPALLEDYDLDIWCYAADVNGRIRGAEDVVYYNNNMLTEDKSVYLPADNRVGGEEFMHLTMSSIPTMYQSLSVFVLIHEAQARRQHFGIVQDVQVIFEDTNTGKVIATYNVTDSYVGDIAFHAGNLARNNGSWEFTPGGTGSATMTPEALFATFTG